MRFSIYIISGAVISGNINENNKNTLLAWYKGKRKNVFTLNDGGVERVLNRKHIALIEFE